MSRSHPHTPWGILFHGPDGHLGGSISPRTYANIGSSRFAQVAFLSLRLPGAHCPCVVSLLDGASAVPSCSPQPSHVARKLGFVRSAGRASPPSASHIQKSWIIASSGDSPAMDANPSVAESSDILQECDPWEGQARPACNAEYGSAARTNAWDSFLPRVGPPGFPLGASAAEWLPEKSASNREYASPGLDSSQSHLFLMSALALSEVQKDTNARLTGKLEAMPGFFHELVTRTFLEDAMKSLSTDFQDQIEKVQQYFRCQWIDVQELRKGVADKQRQVAAEPPTPTGTGPFVKIQHVADGLCAGFEGMARTTATHLSKLEQRVAALENSAVTRTGSVGLHPTSMTGLTRIIQGHR